MARTRQTLAALLLFAQGALAMPMGIALSTFRAQIASARQLVAACGSEATACEASGLPGEEQVGGERAMPGFRMNWDWLRNAVDDAGKEPVTDRARTMRQADDHLAELSVQVSGEGAEAPGEAAFPAAQAAATRVLASDEFRANAGPTWLDRQVARAQDWLLRLLFGAGRVGARNPWIAPLLEWLCFGLALAGLLFFVRRSLQRQSLRIVLGKGAPTATRTALGTTDWIRQSVQAEAEGDWREAIHCLYWGAIAALEARKAWRPNPTRTPREYVRLLRAGSEMERALRALTQRFERTWYGAEHSNQESLQAARREFNAIGAADLKRDRTGTAYETTPAAEGSAVQGSAA